MNFTRNVSTPSGEPVTDQPYQVMPPLTPEEYDALRADITANGVLVPVIRDQHGNLIDGHHRQQIAEELGIHCPAEHRHVDNEDDARNIAYAVNVARRHLTREQKRQLIATEIERCPEDTDRAIGRRLGCDHKTVGSIRRQLSGEIPHLQLSAAQRRKADALLRIMQGRAADACTRVRTGEPIGAFTISNELESDDSAVLGDAWPRFTKWAMTAEDTRGVLWDYADDGDNS